MKKIASFLFLLAIATSCTEDIRRNSPAMQGLKDDVMWRANGVSATLATDGSLTVEGVTMFETLTIKFPNTNEQTFNLGQAANRRVIFVDTRFGDELVYSTSPNIGDGQIRITEFDDEEMTVSGTFRFNAINEDPESNANEVLNFTQGNFYKVPVVPAL